MNGSESAFPVPRAFVTERDYDGQVKQMIQSLPGMSLRAYFAGQALAGFIMHNDLAADGVSIENIASYCVKYADALIAELAKGEK